MTVAIGCGSSPAPTRPAPVVRDAAVIVEPAPTPEECDALIEHAIDLQAPSELGSADRGKLSGEVRDRVLTRCRAMPRAVYRCAMAATATDAFTSCDR